MGFGSISGITNDVENGVEDVGNDVGSAGQAVGNAVGGGYGAVTGVAGQAQRSLGGAGIGELPTWAAPIFPVYYLANTSTVQQVGLSLYGSSAASAAYKQAAQYQAQQQHPTRAGTAGTRTGGSGPPPQPARTQEQYYQRISQEEGS